MRIRAGCGERSSAKSNPPSQIQKAAHKSSGMFTPLDLAAAADTLRTAFKEHQEPMNDGSGIRRASG
jgi:hypothetical protein